MICRRRRRRRGALMCSSSRDHPQPSHSAAVQDVQDVMVWSEMHASNVKQSSLASDLTGPKRVPIHQKPDCRCRILHSYHDCFDRHQRTCMGQVSDMVCTQHCKYCARSRPHPLPVTVINQINNNCTVQDRGSTSIPHIFFQHNLQ